MTWVLFGGVSAGLVFGAVAVAATGNGDRRAWVLRKVGFAALGAGVAVLGFAAGYLAAGCQVC